MGIHFEIHIYYIIYDINIIYIIHVFIYIISGPLNEVLNEH